MSALVDALRRADLFLFHKINHDWGGRWLDAVLPVLTDLHKVRVFTFVLVPAGLALWIYIQRGRAVRVILAAALVVGLTDAFSHRIVKHFIHRLRPEMAGVAAVLRRPSQMGGSFPSNHAANVFAGAAFLSSVYPALRVPFYCAAALVGYSRVYVGVHYPLDAAAGAFLGFIFGRVGTILFRVFERKRKARPQRVLRFRS